MQPSPIRLEPVTPPARPVAGLATTTHCRPAPSHGLTGRWRSRPVRVRFGSGPARRIDGMDGFFLASRPAGYRLRRSEAVAPVVPAAGRRLTRLCLLGRPGLGQHWRQRRPHQHLHAGAGVGGAHLQAGMQVLWQRGRVAQGRPGQRLDRRRHLVARQPVGDGALDQAAEGRAPAGGTTGAIASDCRARRPVSLEARRALSMPSILRA